MAEDFPQGARTRAGNVGDLSASQVNILSGTGDLASMSGHGKLAGTMDPVTLLDTGTYAITYFFA